MGFLPWSLSLGRKATVARGFGGTKRNKSKAKASRKARKANRA